ncbi:MAG: hypothetical protein ACOX0L_06370 [Natronincolaceae bacterium]|jgi:hypothetical protein
MTINDVFKNIYKGESFYICFGNFLDEFYRKNGHERAKMIETEPGYDIPVEQKAFLASAVHKLANDFQIDVPGWVFKKEYYLKEPYFDCNARGKLRLLFMYKSPAEFKHRNVFVDENILQRV